MGLDENQGRVGLATGFDGLGTQTLPRSLHDDVRHLGDVFCERGGRISIVCYRF